MQGPISTKYGRYWPSGMLNLTKVTDGRRTSTDDKNSLRLLVRLAYRIIYSFTKKQNY